MFKFVIQDNKKYLVMRVSKKLYNSRLYPILQMSAISLVVTLIAGFGHVNFSTIIEEFFAFMFSIYVLQLTVILMRFRDEWYIMSLIDESYPVKGGLDFFFPSKMVWYYSFRLVLQNRFMLFHITEVDEDSFCYYKPILCFRRKDCHVKSIGTNRDLL